MDSIHSFTKKSHNSEKIYSGFPMEGIVSSGIFNCRACSLIKSKLYAQVREMVSSGFVRLNKYFTSSHNSFAFNKV